MPPCGVVPPGKTSFQSELVISGQNRDHGGDLGRNGAGCLCVIICPVHTCVFLYSYHKCDPNSAILEKATRRECLCKKIIFLNQKTFLLIVSFCRLVFKIHASILNITIANAQKDPEYGRLNNNIMPKSLFLTLEIEVGWKYLKWNWMRVSDDLLNSTELYRSVCSFGFTVLFLFTLTA